MSTLTREQFSKGVQVRRLELIKTGLQGTDFRAVVASVAPRPPSQGRITIYLAGGSKLTYRDTHAMSHDPSIMGWTLYTRINNTWCIVKNGDIPHWETLDPDLKAGHSLGTPVHLECGLKPNEIELHFPGMTLDTAIRRGLRSQPQIEYHLHPERL